MSELTERLIAVRDRIKPLTRHGEDNIWRPAKDAVEVMADAANRIVELEVALKDVLGIIHTVCPEYDEATMCANARTALACAAISHGIPEVRG